VLLVMLIVHANNDMFKNCLQGAEGSHTKVGFREGNF
jgi:hypothetical protein